MVMEAITFKNRAGQTLVGEQIIVPGFELVDWVYVQDGFFGKIYELATGYEFTSAQGFTPQEAIRDVIGAFMIKNISDTRLLQKFFENDHPHGRKELKIINESPAYLAYKAKQLSDRLAAPFYYSEADRGVIQELIEIMVEENLPHVDIMIKKRDTRISKFVGREPSIETTVEVFQRQRWEYYAMQVRNMGLMMPEQLREYNNYEPKEPTWDNMIAEMNYGRKRDITAHIPQELLNDFAINWEICTIKNNLYGYRRFVADGWAALVRLAIDLKKNRDEQDTITQLFLDFKRVRQELIEESQPYTKLPHEIYI